MPSYRNELKSLDTCSANPAYAPRPNGGRDISCVPRYPTFLRRSAECEVRSCDRLPLADRSDCHRLCPGINSVAHRRSLLGVRPQWPQVLPPTAWYRGRWPRRQPPLTGRHRPRPKGCVLPRFSHGLWGLARYSPPKTRLAHRRIGCLPLPVYAAKFLTIFDQRCPDPVQDAQLYPALEGAVDGAVVGKFFGQLVPLAAAAHTEDDSVQCRPRIDAFAASVFRRIVLVDNRSYLVPQFVRYLPDRWQCLNFFSISTHLRLLSSKVNRWFIGKIECFEIVS